MTDGLTFKAFQPVTRTYFTVLGQRHEDTGPADWIRLRPESFVVRQGFINNATDERYSIDFKAFGENFKYYMSGPLEDRPYEGVIRKMEVWVEDALGYTIAGLKLTPQEAIRLWEGDPFKAIAELFSATIRSSAPITATRCSAMPATTCSGADAAAIS
jgi:hypothetical protein